MTGYEATMNTGRCIQQALSSSLLLIEAVMAVVVWLVVVECQTRKVLPARQPFLSWSLSASIGRGKCHPSLNTTTHDHNHNRTFHCSTHLRRSLSHPNKCGCMRRRLRLRCMPCCVLIVLLT